MRRDILPYVPHEEEPAEGPVFTEALADDVGGSCNRSPQKSLFRTSMSWASFRHA